MLEKKNVVMISYIIIIVAALIGSIYMIFNHDKLNKKDSDKMIIIVTEEYNNESKDAKYQVSNNPSYQINNLSNEKVFMKIIDFNDESLKISFDKDMSIVNSDKTINYDSMKKDYVIYLDSYLMVGIKDDEHDVIYKISYVKENN